MSTSTIQGAVHTAVWDYVLMHVRPNGPSFNWINSVERLDDLLSLPDDPDDPEFKTFDLAYSLLGDAEHIALRTLWDNAVVSEIHLDGCSGAYALRQMNLAKRVVPRILHLFSETPERQEPYWQLTKTGQRLADLLYT